MADDNINPNVEEVVTDQSQPAQPEPAEAEAPAEETPEQPTETPETPEEPAQEPGPNEAPDNQPVSSRFQKRIRDVLMRHPQIAEDLIAPSQPKREDRLDYADYLNADPDVIKDLEADRQREAQIQYQAGLEQAQSMQFHTRLEIDAPKVEAKYPHLNPNSPEFDPIAADDINTLYLHLTGYDARTGRVANPNLRYADFVEAQMGLTQRLAAKKAVDSSKNIAKQSAQTGLRPDGSSAKPLDLNKAPEDMTKEELEAALAQSMPRDARGRFIATK